MMTLSVLLSLTPNPNPVTPKVQSPVHPQKTPQSHHQPQVRGLHVAIAQPELITMGMPERCISGGSR